MVQICAVLVILAACVGYAGWRIYRALTDENEACRGCTLAEKCTKKRKNRKNIWQCREKELPLHPHSE
jgi:hypothetical protein